MHIDPFVRFLSDHRDCKVKLLELGGNGGDQLIRFAERQLMSQAGVIPAAHGEACDFIGYGGGGLYGFYEDAWVLDGIEPGPEPLVFFPRACLWADDEVFDDFVEQMNRIGRPLVIFARDPESANQWRRLVGCAKTSVEIIVSHDAVVLHSLACYDDIVVIQAMLSGPCPNTVGMFFRGDRESIGWPELKVVGMETLRCDPSLMSSCPPCDKRSPLSCCLHLPFLTTCCLPQFAITDRLHAMLARWMFGLDTILLPSAQHKVGAAWEHSIAHNARATRFAQTVDELIGIAEESGLHLDVRDAEAAQ